MIIISVMENYNSMSSMTIILTVKDDENPTRLQLSSSFKAALFPLVKF